MVWILRRDAADEARGSLYSESNRLAKRSLCSKALGMEQRVNSDGLMNEGQREGSWGSFWAGAPKGVEKGY